jgi:hypothetical protein
MIPERSEWFSRDLMPLVRQVANQLTTTLPAAPTTASIPIPTTSIPDSTTLSPPPAVNGSVMAADMLSIDTKVGLLLDRLVNDLSSPGSFTRVRPPVPRTAAGIPIAIASGAKATCGGCDRRHPAAVHPCANAAVAKWNAHAPNVVACGHIIGANDVTQARAPVRTADDVVDAVCFASRVVGKQSDPQVVRSTFARLSGSRSWETMNSTQRARVVRHNVLSNPSSPEYRSALLETSRVFACSP